MASGMGLSPLPSSEVIPFASRSSQGCRHAPGKKILEPRNTRIHEPIIKLPVLLGRTGCLMKLQT